MSLYYDTAPFLLHAEGAGSLKSRIFHSNRPLAKCQPKHIYALASEASKWSAVIAEVVERSSLLELERKLSPELALLLVHDLVVTKRGISAPATHPLRQAVERHKARLSAEFVKARLRRGCSSIEELRTYIETSKGREEATNGPHATTQATTRERSYPRWVRVNVLKTTLEEQIKTTFAAYKNTETLDEILTSYQALNLFVDKHIPNLIALPPSTDLTKTTAYLNGMILLQDKASCFPAYLLDPGTIEGECVDACAAPGNKSTHLAAILYAGGSVKTNPMIHACERDKARAVTLAQMLHKSGAKPHVNIYAGQDFLSTNPALLPWNSVGSLLLDPSCSGSGIVGRDDNLEVVLPGRNVGGESSKAKKRKRAIPQGPVPPATELMQEVPLDGASPNGLASRLRALATFQLKLLLHALSFPEARRITYSTCSIYAEENEQVIIEALVSSIAQERGWRILQRHEQVEGLRKWHVRGSENACRDMTDRYGDFGADVVADACIRCEKGTREGTQGFFLAGFARDDNVCIEQNDKSEWDGFSDTDC
ncbi:MAG: hypothetical protein Q9163_005325 [Psora crenata]